MILLFKNLVPAHVKVKVYEKRMAWDERGRSPLPFNYLQLFPSILCSPCAAGNILVTYVTKEGLVLFARSFVIIAEFAVVSSLQVSQMLTKDFT